MPRPIFDPVKRRSLLLGDLGVEWELRQDFDECRALGGLGGNADAFLGSGILCLLIGLDQSASKLFQKAKQWIEAAIANDERPNWYRAGGTEASRYHTLAICNWLLDARHDADSFQHYVSFEDQYFMDPQVARDKIEASLVVPAYVSARALQRALEIIAMARIPEPKSLNGIRSEAQMSYALARHRLGLEFTSDEIDTALQRFLTRHMDKWLGDGHAVRAAEWMKIAYWDPSESRISPHDAILKCYQHLPNCTRPTC
jgi:hypothetical protein